MWRDKSSPPQDPVRDAPSPRRADEAASLRPRPACICSDALFAGANEVHIEHRGAVYRLQRTSLGKLILTK